MLDKSNDKQNDAEKWEVKYTIYLVFNDKKKQYIAVSNLSKVCCVNSVHTAYVVLIFCASLGTFW